MAKQHTTPQENCTDCKLSFLVDRTNCRAVLCYSVVSICLSVVHVLWLNGASC